MPVIIKLKLKKIKITHSSRCRGRRNGNASPHRCNQTLHHVLELGLLL